MKPGETRSGIEEVLVIMARLRAPGGCPWDRQQNHRSLRRHALEEVYELWDAIEAGDDEGMADELGDLLLQIVFHCQLARERGAFDFDQVCRRLARKLIRRHPHVFGDAQARTAAAVWEQWDKIKRAERHGTPRVRRSALDGIPKHLPALLRVEKLVKQARSAGLIPAGVARPISSSRSQVAVALFELAALAQNRGWSAEELLRSESRRQERRLRRKENSLADGRRRAAGDRRPRSAKRRKKNPRTRAAARGTGSGTIPESV